MFITLSTDFYEGCVDENLTLSTNRNVLVERVGPFMKSLSVFAVVVSLCMCIFMCVCVFTCAYMCVLVC